MREMLIELAGAFAQGLIGAKPSVLELLKSELSAREVCFFTHFA